MKFSNHFVLQVSLLTALAGSTGCSSGADFGSEGKAAGGQPKASTEQSADSSKDVALTKAGDGPAAPVPPHVPAIADATGQMLPMLPKAPLPDLAKLPSSLPKIGVPGDMLPKFGPNGGPDQFIAAVKAKVDEVIGKLQADHPQAPDLRQLKDVADQIQAFAVCLQGQDPAAVQQATANVASSVQAFINGARQNSDGYSTTTSPQAAVASVLADMPQALADFSAMYANQNVDGIGQIFQTIGISMVSALTQK